MFKKVLFANVFGLKCVSAFGADQRFEMRAKWLNAGNNFDFYRLWKIDSVKFFLVLAFAMTSNISLATTVTLGDGESITIGSTIVQCGAQEPSSGTYCSCCPQFNSPCPLLLRRLSDGAILSQLDNFNWSSECVAALAKHPSCR